MLVKGSEKPLPTLIWTDTDHSWANVSCIWNNKIQSSSNSTRKIERSSTKLLSKIVLDQYMVPPGDPFCPQPSISTTVWNLYCIFFYNQNFLGIWNEVLKKWVGFSIMLTDCFWTVLLLAVSIVNAMLALLTLTKVFMSVIWILKFPKNSAIYKYSFLVV